MKLLTFTFITVLTMLISSCTQSAKDDAFPEHQKSPYTVLAIGKTDTAFSSVMFARVQTAGLITVEDSRLKAVLVAYQKLPDGTGKYTIEVTNKQADNVIARWSWEGLRINTMTPVSDVIPANSTVTFELVGTAQLGKIKVKADCPQGRNCNNSSELVINITMEVLPISFIKNSARYDEKTNKVIITFTIDDPTEVEWILIRKQNAQLEWKQVLLIGCDKVTKNYSIQI